MRLNYAQGRRPRRIADLIVLLVGGAIAYASIGAGLKAVKQVRKWSRDGSGHAKEAERLMVNERG